MVRRQLLGHHRPLLVRGPRRPHADSECRNIPLHRQAVPDGHAAEMRGYLRYPVVSAGWRDPTCDSRDHPADPGALRGARDLAQHPHPWPANSPDLSPPELFLWGHLKGMVYKKNHEP